MSVLNWLCLILYFLVALYVINILWKQRRLYYISCKLPGPFALPIIGNLHLFAFCDPNTLLKTLLNLFYRFPPRFRIWLGPSLVIVDSCSADLEIILNSCLDRSKMLHEATYEYFGDGLLTGRYEVWKKQRKYINPSFSSKYLDRFVQSFSENFYNFSQEIGRWSSEKNCDLFSELFRCNIETALKTLCNLDSSSSETVGKYMKTIILLEENLVKSSTSLNYLMTFFLKHGFMSKESTNIAFKASSYLKTIIQWKLEKFKAVLDDNRPESENFLENLLTLHNENKISEKQVMDEFQTMMIAASETVTVTSSAVFTILGIYKEHQHRIFEELNAIYEESDRKLTLNDLKKMTYLECVIKETLRLYPPTPMLLRQTIDQFILPDGLIVPPNTIMLIPICKIHTDPKLWNNPLKFDPNRFSPEKSKKQPKLSYLLFSYGLRDCIGHKYAMLAVKAMTSEVLRRYRIVPLKYKSIEDLEYEYVGIVKFQDGCPVRLENRCK